MVPGPVASTSPENMLDEKIHRLHLRLTEFTSRGNKGIRRAGENLDLQHFGDF